MDHRFSDVRVLIWDFDGTLYKNIPALWQDILESDYRVVMDHTGWSREKVIEEYSKIYKIKTPSSTVTASMLSNIPVSQVAVECEKYKDRKKYLKRDEKLIALFQNLRSFTHYMLVNGIQEKTKESLAVLGIPLTTFAEIVTSEVVGENKPSEKGFRYIIEKTGLLPEKHMMIGDREPVDLVSAKKLGMHTCLVWAEKPGDVADVTVPTVYDVESLIE